MFITINPSHQWQSTVTGGTKRPRVRCSCGEVFVGKSKKDAMAKFHSHQAEA